MPISGSTPTRPICARKQTSTPGMFLPSPDSRRRISIDSTQSAIAESTQSRKRKGQDTDDEDEVVVVDQRRKKITKSTRQDKGKEKAPPPIQSSSTEVCDHQVIPTVFYQKSYWVISVQILHRQYPRTSQRRFCAPIQMRMANRLQSGARLDLPMMITPV